MRTIWKYPIPIGEDMFTYSMPEGATFLCIGSAPQTALWYDIPDDSAPKVEHTFMVYGTGFDIPETGITYIGTYFWRTLVWHVYEVKP